MAWTVSNTEATMRRTFASLAVGLVLLAACGGEETPASETPSPRATASPTTEASPEPTGALVESMSSDLGTIVADAEGMTLYFFLNDTNSESTCYDQCAGNWPAYTTQGEPQAGAGIDASLLGTTTRTDGTVQVTYNGKPLYHFAGDENPGDTNGQGIGDVWFVASAAGEPIRS
jgi:predicted lipoprotein with Yx(FWY)xxD motif